MRLMAHFVPFKHLFITGFITTLMVACAAEPIKPNTGSKTHWAPQALAATTTPAQTAAPKSASEPKLIATTAADSNSIEAQPPHLPELSFQQWCRNFRAEALGSGISASVLDQALIGLTPDPDVITADRSQPEFTRPIWEYLEGALSLQRITTGQRLLTQQDELLRRIEAQYGVDRHVLVAIWGLESNFGRGMGNKSIIRSLATLAHEGRRPDFAKTQLLAALRILQNGDIRPERMIGSWAGAMGQTQFIPTTYQDYAVDFDGDGRRDIWDSTADALASTAHYIQASGWANQYPWGFEVQLPQHFDYALADPDIRKPITEWRKLGVMIPSLPSQDAASGNLLLPAGYRGPAFLVLDNFRTVLRYNNSTSYALAVNLLAERFQGRGHIVASWPKNQRTLSRTERVELQERLNNQGLNTGTPDGIIGSNTRRAIRTYQQRFGWPADGYPTTELLVQLRSQN